jgi:hypothetical protein
MDLDMQATELIRQNQVFNSTYSSYQCVQANKHSEYGQYASYGEYAPGYKRDAVVEAREAEAAPAPVAAPIPKSE